MSPEEARVVPGDRVRVTVRATNLSGQAARARVSHRVEPRTQADSLALLQCPLLVPLTLAVGQSQEFARGKSGKPLSSSGPPGNGKGGQTNGEIAPGFPGPGGG